MFGTLQCFWKYKRSLFSRKRLALGWVILPNILLCNTVVPLFFPLVDLLSLLGVVLGNGSSVLKAYLTFMAIDFAFAALGFIGEADKKRLLLYLPLQRLFYRQLMSLVIFKSLIKAIEGTATLWNKVKRSGQAQQFFLAQQGDGAGLEQQPTAAL